MPIEDEGTFRTALGMCQMLLRQRADETGLFIKPQQINQAVTEITALATFSRVDKTLLTAELEKRFTVYAPAHYTLGQDDNHQPWLPNKRGQINWQFW